MLKPCTICIILGLLVLLFAGCERKTAPLPPARIEDNQTVSENPVQMSSRTQVNINRVDTASIPILMYHSIASKRHSTLFVPPKIFENQMKHLKVAGYHTMTFSDLMNWKTGNRIPDKPVMITFDDGYLDNFTAAYPILKKLHMKATIFTTSDFIGFPRHLSWNQIKEMEQSGCIEIGVHTRHHAELTKNTPLQLIDEIWGAKQRLEKRLGHPIIAFAYPSGKFNRNVVEVVRRAGFQFAVTTKPGYAVKSQGSLTLHRVRIPGGQSMSAFIQEFP